MALKFKNNLKCEYYAVVPDVSVKGVLQEIRSLLVYSQTF